MGKSLLRKLNHAVPRVLLKRFSSSPGHIWEYKLLVSHSTVREWNEVAISRVAANQHLYTVAKEDEETDDFEVWLSEHFDSPAAKALELVEHQMPLLRTDWQALIRFFAAQRVRTPAAYLKSRAKGDTEGEQHLRESLVGLEDKLRATKLSQEKQIVRPYDPDGLFPMRAVIEPSEDSQKAKVKVEMVYGRRMWLWEIKNALRTGGPIDHLLSHRWTILLAPEGSRFVTCDDPAIQLGLNPDGTWNRVGGWGASKHVLYMPLSPRLLLYTQIDEPSPPKYTELSKEKVSEINRVIVENALRSVYASSPMKEVQIHRPRTVNVVQYKAEEQEWLRWHTDQSIAENFR